MKQRQRIYYSTEQRADIWEFGKVRLRKINPLIPALLRSKQKFLIHFHEMINVSKRYYPNSTSSKILNIKALFETVWIILSCDNSPYPNIVQPLIYVPVWFRVSGRGGRIFRDWCGLIWLYCLSHILMTIWAWSMLVNHSALRTSWRRVPLKRSL